MFKKTKILLVSVLLVIMVTGFFGCQPKETEKPKEKIKIAFLLSGTGNDGSWNQAHYEGANYLKSQLSDIEVSISERVSQDAAEKVMRDYANQGYKVIFTCEYGFMDPTINVAKDFPNVIFENCSGYKTAENVATYFGRIEQVDYLAGLIAGKMTKSNYIGVIASFPIPQTIRETNAIAIGARQVNPKAEIHVIWMNSWYDPTRDAVAARTLISNGADIIVNLIGDVVTLQEAEKAGVYSIGYYYNQNNAAPNSVLTSRMFNWGVYYVKTIKEVQNGTWKTHSYWGGLDEGVVTLAPFGSMVPDDVKSLVEQKKQDIISGKYNLFSGPLYDQEGNLRVNVGEVISDEELLNMQWFVQGVIGTIPEGGS